MQTLGLALIHLGIVDGSTLIVREVDRPQPSNEPRPALSMPMPLPTNEDVSIYTLPPNIQPDQLMQLCSQNSRLLSQFKHSDPELHKHLEAKDISALRMTMMKRYMKGWKVKYEEAQDEKKLLEDPNNPELQKKLQEKIDRENIEQSLIIAMENFPETFGHVTMLYVNLEINNVSICVLRYSHDPSF